MLLEEPFNATNVAFAENDDLNLEAANLDALDLYSDSQEVFGGDNDIFYDCQSDFDLPTIDIGELVVVHDYSTIFKVATVSSTLEDDISDEVETCCTIKRVEKKSLHVPIQVCG